MPGSVKYGCDIQTESSELYAVAQMMFSGVTDCFHRVRIQSY